MDKEYFNKMFIDEAKPALNRHSGGGGSGGESAILRGAIIDKDGSYTYSGIRTITPRPIPLRDKIDIEAILRELTSLGAILSDCPELLYTFIEYTYDDYNETCIFIDKIFWSDDEPFVLRIALCSEGDWLDLAYLAEKDLTYYGVENEGWYDCTYNDEDGISLKPVNHPIELSIAIDPNKFEYNESYADIVDKYIFTRSIYDVLAGVGDVLVHTYQFLSNRLNAIGGYYLCANWPETHSLDWLTEADTSMLTDTRYMFILAHVTHIPSFNTSNVTNMDSMFFGCTDLTDVSLFDTSNVTNMSYMFDGCTSLSEVPLFDTSNVTNMTYMFNGCTSLTEVPLFNTSNATNIEATFQNCAKLKTIPELDIANVNKAVRVVVGCKNLTDIRFRNIKVALTVGSGTSYGHLLTLDSLIWLIKELRQTTSTSRLTVGTANMTKLANVYVRTIDITDTMRAEDPYIDEKLPFEVCDSNADGAVLITNYVAAKKWELA